MQTQDNNALVFDWLPVPMPTIPYNQSDPSQPQGKEVDEVLKQASNNGGNGVFTAHGCAADHMVHVYVGVADASTGTSYLIHDFPTKVHC